jgi:hypothetical protein
MNPGKDWNVENASIEPEFGRFCGDKLFVSKQCTMASGTKTCVRHCLHALLTAQNCGFYAFAASTAVAGPI